MPKKQTETPKAPEKTFSLISNEKLLAIYTAMLKCRLLEQRATSLFQHGKLDSDLHLSAGREATAAAAVVDLEPADTLCIAPNDWLPAFVKGMSLETLFRALAPSSLHVAGSVQIEADHKNIFHAATRPDLPEILLERASAASGERKGAVAAAFIPQGAALLEQWEKTIQSAGSKKLPAIFIHYSDAAEEKNAGRSAKPEALLHGVPSIAVDARDPVAVYRVAYEAIVRARQRRGATLLECFIDIQPSSPNDGTSTGADPITTDSIAAMESYLKSKGINVEANNPEIIGAFNRDLDLATRFLEL